MQTERSSTRLRLPPAVSRCTTRGMTYVHERGTATRTPMMNFGVQLNVRWSAINERNLQQAETVVSSTKRSRRTVVMSTVQRNDVMCKW